MVLVIELNVLVQFIGSGLIKFNSIELNYIYLKLIWKQMIKNVSKVWIQKSLLKNIYSF